MENTDLFTLALQLEYPWKVSKVEFLPDDDDPKTMTLHITPVQDKEEACRILQLELPSF